MASGPEGAAAAQEPSDTSEECPVKKKSKFQTFKNFFAKKKRKEVSAPVGESGLKSSHSSDDLNTPEPTPISIDKDNDSGSKVNMGNKALSHDSVFTSDSPSSETNEALRTSQDSIHGKVKSLQLQLKQAIRLGSPQAVVSTRKGEDAGAVSEDDGLPCSPPEYSTLHTVLATSSQRSSGVVQRSSSLSLERSDSDDDQMSNEASSRPCTPQTAVPVDFSQPASSLTCLDSSAARHRIAVKANACAKRKPASKEMLQSKRRDLRERVLLRDTEDKMRAVRTCTEEEEEEEEENEANNSEADVAEIVEVCEESQPSPSVSGQNEEELPTSSQSQRVSTTSAVSDETSEEEERVPDEDHVTSSEIPESSWVSPVTLELQADDFLLDTECEVVSEKQGSLLEEVLSSLKGPLTSGLVLEAEDVEEQMEVEDVTKDVQDNPVEEATTDQSDFTDPTLVSEDQLILAQNTLSGTDEQEADEPSEEEEEPEEQECAEQHPFEEDPLVCKDEEGQEEDEEEEEHTQEMTELTEEVYMEEDTIKEDVEEVGVNQEEETKMEENMEEEEKREYEEQEVKEVGVEDAEEEEEEEELIEENKEDIEEPEEGVLDEEEEEEENEAKNQTCPMDTEEESEMGIERSFEEFSETDHSVKGSDSISAEIVTQPEDLPPQEPTKRPSFVVSTSLDLSLPSRVPYSPKQSPEADTEPETLQLVASEKHALEESQEQSSASSEFAEEQQHTPTDSTEKSLPCSAESRLRFTISPAWQRSLSGGSAKEQPQAVILSATEDEPIFKESPSRDQAFIPAKPDQPVSPIRTQSVPSLPLQRDICQANEDASPENPFGVRLRKTAMLHRYASEGDSPNPNFQEEPLETPKTPILEQLARKPVVPKKPDQLTDGSVKPKRGSDLAVAKASMECSESPSWISVARQKQKLFKESSLEEVPERKFQEEFNKKGSLPDLSSQANKDHLKPVASPVKVSSCSLEISKPASVEKENKRNISHPPAAPLAQDEPPWLALAKKKAKAWSEMPQIVQ